jgi:hypothetical protein
MRTRTDLRTDLVVTQPSEGSLHDPTPVRAAAARASGAGPRARPCISQSDLYPGLVGNAKVVNKKTRARSSLSLRSSDIRGSEANLFSYR